MCDQVLCEREGETRYIPVLQTINGVYIITLVNVVICVKCFKSINKTNKRLYNIRLIW